jgi:hypothetical protein
MKSNELNLMMEKFQYANLSRGDVIKVLIILNQMNIVTYEEMCDAINEISPLDNA